MSAGLVATASYLPERFMTAAEISELSGIPEDVMVRRFGLRGKHIAAPDEHVTDLSVEAASKLLAETGCDPASLDVVCYFGSSYKEYPVWQAAPWIAHRIGASHAFALELDYVSCGGPVAMRVSSALLAAEPSMQRVLLVGASRESYLLDYANPRSRFMFNFGDGAVAALLERSSRGTKAEVLGSHAITDGSLSPFVKVPVGGSVRPVRLESGEPPYALDVEDPAAMKERLDEVSLERFLLVARVALERSGRSLAEVSWLCPLHMKRSMHEAVLAELGVPQERAVYLEDTGHMSGVDSLLGLDRLANNGVLREGDLVLLLAAGTGYTWAATVLAWN